MSEDVLAPTRQRIADLVLRRASPTLPSVGETIMDNTYDALLINPTQSVLYAIGVYDQAEVGSVTRQWAALALCQSISWMGYHAEAYAFYTTQIDPHAPLGGPVMQAYRTWVWFTAAKRIEGLQPSELKPIMRTFQENGRHLAYYRCTQEAIQDDIIYNGQRFPDARERFEAMRTFYLEQGHTREYGMSIIHELHGMVFSYTHSQADERLEDLERYAEGSAFLRYYLLAFQASLCTMRLNYEQAQAHLQEAHALAHANRWGFPRVYANYDLAILFNDIGRPQEALTYGRSGFELASTFKHRVLQAEGHQLLGQSLLQMGRLAEANKHLNRVIYDYAEVPATQFTRAFAWLAKGELALLQGELADAFAFLKQAYELREHIGRLRFIITASALLSVAHYSTGNEEEADALLEELFTYAEGANLFERSIPGVLRLVRVCIELGKMKRAYVLLTHVQEILSNDNADGVTPHIRHVVELAEAELQLADVLWQRRGPERDAALSGLLTRLMELASLFEADERWHDALEAKLAAAHAAVERGDTSRVERLLNAIHPAEKGLYAEAYTRHLHAELADRQGRTDEALRERLEALIAFSRARSTLNSERDAGRYATANRSTYEQALSYGLDYGAHDWTLRYVEAASSQSLRASMGIPLTAESVTGLVARIRQQMNARHADDWTILRYASFDDIDMVFTLTPDSLTMDILEPEWMVLNDIGMDPNYRNRYGAYWNAHITKQHARLHDDLHAADTMLLRGGVRERLHPDHRLLIVRSGRWSALPFQALMANGMPLLNRAIVSYAPSLLTLSALMERPLHSERRGRMFGQTDFEEPKLENLNSPRIEGGFLEAFNYIDFECTLNEHIDIDLLLHQAAAGALRPYSHLHFATHTREHEEAWSRSGLILNGHDITVSQVRRWQLGAECVTLPSCITGSGTWYPGDETVGIAQAFLIAGARAVMATHWRTIDVISPTLVEGFYTQLAAGDDPAYALVHAQRNLYDTHADNIFLWAPYHLTGASA